MKKTIYILTVVNEDLAVAMCDAYPSFEKAQAAMRRDISAEAGELASYGFEPKTKVDERCAVLEYGDGHLYRYEISRTEI